MKKYDTNGYNSTQKKNIVSASTICQDFIQNRLYLNKAMMNSVEPYLESIKLQQLLNSLYEKIDLDKEILLVFTHIKREETHLNSLEPLQPLFKRYSLGFERCIHIWRKKCSGDSLLLFNDSFVDPLVGATSTSAVDPQHEQQQQQLRNKTSSPGDRRSLSSNLTAAAAALSAATLAASNLNSTKNVINSSISINIKGDEELEDDVDNDMVDGDDEAAAMTQSPEMKHHKYYSEMNLFTKQLNTSVAGGATAAATSTPQTTVHGSNLKKKLIEENSVEQTPTGGNAQRRVSSSISVETQTINNTAAEDDRASSPPQPVLNRPTAISSSPDEIEKLNQELKSAREMINQLKMNEARLAER